MATALPIISSGHSPILLKPKPPLTSGISFKYDALWEENEECREIVSNGWNITHLPDSWGNWNAKVSSCTNHLKRWKSNVFKNAAKEIKVLRGNLEELLNKPKSSIDWE